MYIGRGGRGKFNNMGIFCIRYIFANFGYFGPEMTSTFSDFYGICKITFKEGISIIHRKL